MVLSVTALSPGWQIPPRANQPVREGASFFATPATQELQKQLRISSLAYLRFRMSDMQGTLTALRNPSVWSTTVVKSSNPAAVQVSDVGTHPLASINVGVQKVAQAQTITTGRLSSVGTGWGGGTIRLQSGTWSSPTTFVAGPTTVDIDVDPGDSTQEVAQKINTAQTQVRASVLTESDGGQRLLLEGTQTGAQNGFKFSVTQTSGAASPNHLSNMAAGAQWKQQAQDAKFTINGAPMSSASNTVSNASGFNFTIQAATASPVRLTSTKTIAPAQDAIKSFVAKYNAMTDNLMVLNKYNATASKFGMQQGDVATLATQGLMRSLVSKAIERGSFAGLSMDGSRRIKTNTFLLDKALSSNPREVQNLFTNEVGTGLADMLDAGIDAALGANGLFKPNDLAYTQRLGLLHSKEYTPVASPLFAALPFQGPGPSPISLRMASLYWSVQNNS